MGELKLHYKGVQADCIPLDLQDKISNKFNKGLVCIYSKSYFCSYILPIILYGTNFTKKDYVENRSLWSKAKHQIHYVNLDAVISLISKSSLDLSTISNYYNLYNNYNTEFISLCNQIIDSCLSGFFYNKHGILAKFFK